MGPRMMTPNETNRLIGLLYTSNNILLGFVLIAVPTVLRGAGVPLEQIGIIQLFSLIGALKFAWAPVLDRLGGRRGGHYRSWIVWMQAAAVACMAFLAAFDPERGILLPALALLALNGVIATQEIANDATTTLLIPPDARGVGNGVQSAGRFLGAMLGGGGVLVLHDLVGWHAATAVLALVLLVPFVPMRRYVEPPDLRPPALATPARSFASDPSNRVWLGLLVLVYMGLTGPYLLVSPMLVDLGWSFRHVGLAVNVVGSLAAVAAALMAGRWFAGMPRKAALLVALAGQVGCTAPLLLLDRVAPEGLAGYAILASLLVGQALVLTAASMAVMDHVRRASAAADYALQSCAMYFGGIVMSAASFALAGSMGYKPVLLLNLAVSLSAAVGVLGLFAPPRIHAEEPA